MPDHLPDTLPSFAAAKLLVVGDIMLDRYWFGDTGRISPEAPVPIVHIQNEDQRPGGAANVALNIASLGAEVFLLGITGTDEAASLLSKQLDQAAVQHALYQDSSIKTIIKLRVISRHQQLLRLDFEGGTLPNAAQILLDQFKQQLANTQLIILSDYKKGTLADPQAFIQLAKQAHIPVLVDPKGTDFNIYQGADIITPNLKEFEAVMGSCKNENDLIQKGRRLLQKFHIGSLLVTRGEAGMTLIDEHHTSHFPAYAREVFDVTGAGDTVIATLGTALAAKASLLSSTALANLAASIAVSKLGAATINPTELEAARFSHNNLSSGIVDETTLVAAVQRARAQGKKIVFTNGCFDVLHSGHTTYLNQAKKMGDYLIVAINTDESLKKIKGEHRPIHPLADRMAVLSSLSAVDWVIPFGEETPERLLRLIQPDLLVKGGDYQLNEIVGAEIVRAYGGEVRVMHHNIRHSSTKIIAAQQIKQD